MKPSQIIDSYEQIIADTLAFNVSQYEEIAQNANTCHIPLTLFDSPKHLQITVLKLLQLHLQASKCKSVIGFTCNDPSLIVLAAQASLNAKLPLYLYDSDNDNTFDEFIRPEMVPYSLIIPFSTNESHVMKIVKIFTAHKVPVTQVISFIDENESKYNFSNENFEFVTICNWAALRDKISQHQNITKKRIDEILANLS